MPRATVAVLKAQPYGPWVDGVPREDRAGGLGPYSLELLERHGFDLLLGDRAGAGFWAAPAVERNVARVERRDPRLRGMANALANRRLLRRADIRLGIFEDQGSFLAALPDPLRQWVLRPGRVVLMVCWMAERAAHASERELSALRQVARGADLLFCFSENQRSVFVDRLGVDPARLRVVPFGVDVGFFAAVGPDSGDAVDAGGEFPRVVAVGRDVSRDHELLAQALRGSGIRARIHAPELGVADLPEEIDWRPQRISHLEYRQALQDAAVVVVPVHPLRYPGGQTVVLEAMAAGRAVVTTDSAALREYVDDGRTGILVPPGDPRALRTAVAGLLRDGSRRAALAAAGRAEVRRRFTQDAMWSAVADALREG